MLQAAIAELRQEDAKFAKLYQMLSDLAPFTLAFSGGVDSALLLALASTLSGKRQCSALTIKMPYTARWEVTEAIQYAAALSFKHAVIALEMPDSVRDNPAQRCYFCKRALMTALRERADAKCLIDGSNYDDLSDYRPGMRALKECGVVSPLLLCEVTKGEIRQWSKRLALPTWDKPAYACLLTRLEHNQTVERATLDLVEAAEIFLFSLEIRDVRVRKHASLARIEVKAADLPLVIAKRDCISAQLMQLGFSHVTLDLIGYRPSGQQYLAHEGVDVGSAKS